MCEPEFSSISLPRDQLNEVRLVQRPPAKRAGRFMTTCDYRTCVEEDEQPSDALHIKGGLNQSQNSSVRPLHTVSLLQSLHKKNSSHCRAQATQLPRYVDCLGRQKTRQV